MYPSRHVENTLQNFLYISYIYIHTFFPSWWESVNAAEHSQGVMGFSILRETGGIWVGGRLSLRYTDPSICSQCEGLFSVHGVCSTTRLYLCIQTPALPKLWAAGSLLHSSHCRQDDSVGRIWFSTCTACGLQWTVLRRNIDNVHGRLIWMKSALTSSLEAE